MANLLSAALSPRSNPARRTVVRQKPGARQLLRTSILSLAMLLAACRPEMTPTTVIEPSPALPEATEQSKEEWHLVVIGDSSLWRLGKAYAAQIEGDLGVPVVLVDNARPALSAGAVLEDLRQGTPPYQGLSPEAVNALRQAQTAVVVMFVNPRRSIDPERPLDMEDCFHLQPPGTCTPDTFARYVSDLEAIWAGILELRGGKPAILRATDLYNPLVSPWREAGVFEECSVCWQNLSDATRQAAATYSIPFLSRFEAFNGPDRDEDPREKGYIISDGEHPSDVAAQYTAGLLSEMGYEPVSPPAAAPVIQITSGQAQEAIGTAAEGTPPNPYSLSEPGPYFSGKSKAVFEDPSRSNRRVGVSIWYPALLPEGASETGTKLMAGRDREPDRSGAPYPLILSSTKMAQDLAPRVVSHGFTWASVDGIDTWLEMDEEMILQPLDILFALDQVAAHPPNGLEGMIDAEHAGATGYSFGGYNTLALSGARIDPGYYLAQCPTPDATTEALVSSLSAFDCGPASAWDEYASHAGKAITQSEDGLWQPMTDARIRAVMPMAGEGWWLFGERGLAAADRPALFLAGTEDELYAENVQIFANLGAEEKGFVSFIGRDHMMVYDMEVRARMAHFAAAFFGHHLQGQEELAAYYSEEFVRAHDDLAWGPYRRD